MKTIISGSREIDSYELVRKAIDESKFEISEVVCGGARGVDTLGEQWAIRHFVPVQKFLPDWSFYGKRAGMVRNDLMAKYADALIAVWDGESRGTKSMIEMMQKRGLPVFIKKI